ncbi:MAG: acylphosphatase [bacterium]
MAKAFRAIIRGRVQGVGFRYFTARAARQLGITGGVRNLPDGTVEAEAAGSDPNLREFLAELHRGPSFSTVASVDVEWLDAAPEHDSFEVGF